MKIDYTDKPILITGAARSGTSMVAGITHLCGAWKGDTVGPSTANQKGMFENQAIRQNIIKPLFAKLDCDKLAQFPLPKTKDIIIPYNFREQVLNEIRSQGWTPDQPWMYKCAKMSLIWPVWAYAFPDSKWIIVRRKKDDIVDSCVKTTFMRAFTFPENQREVGAENEKEGWKWWVESHIQKFAELMEAGMNCKVIWPERLIKWDYSEMQEIIDWLGLTWNMEAVSDFIEPKLWKARKHNKMNVGPRR